MAMTVVLLEQTRDEFCLRPEAVSALGRLGITNLAVARDEQTVAVVLEGWLFDAVASAPAAGNALEITEARTLYPVMQLTVSGASLSEEINPCSTTSVKS